MNTLNLKKGFSLTEVLLVIGIVATIIVSTFITYIIAFSTNNVNNEVQISGQLAQDISEMYAMSPDYNGIDTNNIIKNGFIPANRVPGGYESGNKIVHKIGSGANEGLIEIDSVSDNNSSSSSGKYFRIQYTHVGKKECIDLAQKSSQYFDIIYIGSGSNGGSEVKEQGETLDINNLIEECGDDNTVSLIKA